MGQWYAGTAEQGCASVQSITAVNGAKKRSGQKDRSVAKQFLFVGDRYDSLTSCFIAQSGKTGGRRSRGPPAFEACACPVPSTISRFEFTAA